MRLKPPDFLVCQINQCDTALDLKVSFKEIKLSVIRNILTKAANCQCINEDQARMFEQYADACGQAATSCKCALLSQTSHHHEYPDI